MNTKMQAKGLLALFGAALVAMSPAAAQPAAPVFIAATWSDQAVHFLDAGLNDISSFAASEANPNGIATDGVLIYTGHFSTSEVIAYDFAGVEQFRWSGAFSNLQGMEMFGDEMVIWNSDDIQFRDAMTGTLNRTLSLTGLSVEGLAFDGSQLWLLDEDELLAVNPYVGNIERSIPNAASECGFSGTGITASAPGELHLACNDGSWFQVSSADGGVLDSGNNGLDMFGLKLAAGSPQPVGLAPVPVSGPLGWTLMILFIAGLAVARLRRQSA